MPPNTDKTLSETARETRMRGKRYLGLNLLSPSLADGGLETGLDGAAVMLATVLYVKEGGCKHTQRSGENRRSCK